MTQIIRKGISFDKNELKEFDKLIKTQGYSNRSQAIRNLIRKELIENKNKKPERETVATLTMKYNHHEHHVQHELTHKQHTFQGMIKSTLHIHLDEDNCLEMLVLEGKTKNIQKLSDSIISTKGVIYGKLVIL